MELMQRDMQWDAFLNAMIAGAMALRPTPATDIGYPIGIAPVQQPQGGMGGMMGGMGGMMGGGGSATGGASGAAPPVALGTAMPMAADGGNFPAGHPVLVGERGPEVVVPQQAITVIPGQQGTPPSTSSPDIAQMMRQILAAQIRQQQPDKEEPGGFRWQYLIPGGAEGMAKLQAMKIQKQEIDLRKRQIAGQEAQQQLGQLQLLRKVQREDTMAKLAPMFGALHATEDPAQAVEYERQIMEGLVREGDIEGIQKFRDSQLQRKQLRAIQDVQSGAEGPVVERDRMPQPESAVPAQEPAPSADLPATYAQDMVALRGMEQELQTEEAKLRMLGRMTTFEGGKNAYAAARERVNDLSARLKQQRDRMSFSDSPIERVTGQQKAYLTPGQMRAGGTELEIQAIRRAGAIGSEAAARTAEAAARTADATIKVAEITGRGQVINKVDVKRFEKLDEAAGVAVDTLGTLDEVTRLINEGVYGTSPKDLAIMELYTRKIGFQGDPRAIRTARIRELGSTLILAHGTLGSNVSNTDAAIYAKAAGNFEKAKNIPEMMESIKSMTTILQKAIAYADYARTVYPTTGKMPKFSDVPPGMKTPSGGTITLPTTPTPPSQKPVSELTPQEMEQEQQRLEEYLRQQKAKEKP